VTIQIELKPDEERALLERARLSGRDPGQYARQLILDHIAAPQREETQASSIGAGVSVEALIDHEYVADCARDQGFDVPGIDEVRKILAKIPGSLAEEIIAEREDRL
jgi:hypothetical protein